MNRKKLKIPSLRNLLNKYTSKTIDKIIFVQKLLIVFLLAPIGFAVNINTFAKKSLFLIMYLRLLTVKYLLESYK